MDKLRGLSPPDAAYYLHHKNQEENILKANDTNLVLAPQQVSIDVLLEKYAKGEERSVEDVRRRVARALPGSRYGSDHCNALFRRYKSVI